MSCCNALPPPMLECSNDFQQRTKNLWLELKEKNDRKAIKLLFRQYEIESLMQEAPEYHDTIEVRQMPLIITYYHYTNPRKKFTWVLESYKFQIHY